MEMINIVDKYKINDLKKVLINKCSPKKNDIYIPIDNINEIFKFASFSTKLYIIDILNDKINYDLIITEIPDKFISKLTDDILSQSKFRKLTHLEASNNENITDVSVKLLTNLTYLEASGNKNITDESIRLLTKLIHLDANGYNSNITDESIQLSTNLTHLDASSNENITDESIKLLTNLTSLNASYNKYITDKSVKLLTNLTYLNACGNKYITDERIMFILY